MLIDAFLPLHQTIQAATEGEYRFVAKWGPPDLTRDGNVQNPTGIAVDTAGLVYVADRGNNRVQKFTSAGNLISKWGSHGSGDGQLACISGIAADSLGYVYVTDSCNHRIQKFSPSGTFIAKWGAQGEGNGYFSENGPNNIAVDAEGNVYVTDTSAWTVQKFAPGTATAAGNSLYFPHVDTNLPWQTEVAIINTSDQTVTSTLRALSNAGQLMESKAITLPAHGRRQITVANEFSNSTNIGYLIFDTSSDTVQGYTKFYQAGVYRAAIPAVKEVNSGAVAEAINSTASS